MNPPPDGREWRSVYSSYRRYPPYARGEEWKHHVGSEERERYWPKYEEDPSQKDHLYPPPQGYYGGYEQAYYSPSRPSEWQSFGSTHPHYPPPDNRPVTSYGPPTTDFGHSVQGTWVAHGRDTLATRYEPFPSLNVSEVMTGTQRSHDLDDQSRTDCGTSNTLAPANKLSPARNVREDLQCMQRSCDPDDQSCPCIDHDTDQLPSNAQFKRDPPSLCSSVENNANTDQAHDTSCDLSHDMADDIGAVELEQASSEFQNDVKYFVAKRKELFDKLLGDVGDKEGKACPISAIHACGDWYADPDPLEFHMGVGWKLRWQKFFELLACHDIVRGHVIMVRPHGVFVRVTSFVYSLKSRELPDLKIKGLVAFENLAETQEDCKKLLEELQEEDVVQAVVTGVDEDEGLVKLSFKQNHLPTGKQDVALGYLEGRKPLNSRSKPEDDEYLQMLKSEPAFSNPDCVENLKAILGLPSSCHYTLMSPILMNKFPESEYYDSLRKVQRRKWSMESVATGVKHFKSGDLSSALRHFNHALEIDNKNVEGLVARGALHANQNHFEEGIRDFEKALTINHAHRNAKNYLVETQIAYGKKLEEQGKPESALHCYKEALADNPESEVAKRRAEFITIVLERQAAEKRERERKREEGEDRLRKLQKIIKKERKRERRRDEDHHERKRKHHTKKKSKTRDKKRKRKHHHHHHTSSESSRASSDSSYSSSPSPRRRH